MLKSHTMAQVSPFSLGLQKCASSSKDGISNRKASLFQAGQRRASDLLEKTFIDKADDPPRIPAQLSTLQLRYVIGKGAFGTVNLALASDSSLFPSLKNDPTKPTCVAVKIIPKEKVLECSVESQALTEVAILKRVGQHPFIVTYAFAYQTPTKLYIGMEFCSGGELFTHILYDTLSFHDIRLYICEIALALRCLHRLNIVYRDLKPENIAIGEDGHIRLLDFGLSIFVDEKGEFNPETQRYEVSTSCGTLAYSAPEILKRQGHSFESDWWSLGIIAYELLCGYPPFQGQDAQMTCNLICTAGFDAGEEKYMLPGSPEYDLVSRLLCKQPRNRLCYYMHQFDQLAQHPFFCGLDFEMVESLNVQPQQSYHSKDPLDVSRFDEEFTSEIPNDMYNMGPVVGNSLFQGYTAIPETSIKL
mmetsp:Transcript_18594/g.40209  ORF Transcript_18594/g.40209 Transcript_18594/m.40209 type:complete len:417 (-) Transcript_18594:41-1291(-)